MSAKFTDKVAIITGASSGIGAATAKHFASLGCFLLLAGRDQTNLQQTQHACAQLNQTIKVITCSGDVTDADYLKQLVQTAIDTFAKIDILVNSAGIVVNGGAMSTAISEYDRVHDVNVRSIVQLTQLCIPHLIKTKGTVVNVSSINGICSFPTVTFYCMSKAALDQFTKCLALELAPSNVRVNSVNPGCIVTNVHRRAGMSEEDYQKFLNSTKNAHALGRVGEADEVAKAIAFLASDDSSFTTGELLRVDGGRGIITPR